MAEMEDYQSNCDYIREKFELPVNVSVYAIVNKITEQYKILKDKETLAKAKTTLKKENGNVGGKKRGPGRPRKSSNN